MKKIKFLIEKELTDYKFLLRSIPSPTILFFTLSVVCANLMANKELFNYKYLAIDCGFVFSWIMFICMDIICKRWGARATIKVSVFALLINLIVCFSFYVLSKTTGNWGEYYSYSANPQVAQTVNDILNKTIGGSWYVVFGSAIAFLISSTINAVINKRVGVTVEKHLKKDNFTTFAIRSYVSTFVAQFSDNFIFATIVSRVFFGWNWTQIIFCSLFGAICELLCEILFSKWGYKILISWEQENIGQEYISYKKGK